MPPRSHELTLPQRVLLLALRDEKGTVESKAAMHAYALGGAILAELLLFERVRVGEDKKKLVSVADLKPTGDLACWMCEASCHRSENVRQGPSVVSTQTSPSSIPSRSAISRASSSLRTRSPKYRKGRP